MSPTSENQPELPQQPPQVAEDPSQESGKLVHQASTTTAFQFSGPVPPPSLMRQYEEISPGLASKMFSMAERESEHRHRMEAKIVESHCADQDAFHEEVKRGQVCATLITVFAITAGAYTAVQGHEIAGGILGAAGIGGIAINLILGRNARSANNIESVDPSADPGRNPKK